MTRVEVCHVRLKLEAVVCVPCFVRKDAGHSVEPSYAVVYAIVCVCDTAERK